MTTTLKAGLAGLATALLCAAASPSVRADRDDGFFFGFATRNLRLSISGYDHRPPPPRCGLARRWTPGHTEARLERVCIPGHWDTVVEPAACGWVGEGWRWRHAEVRPACTRRLWVPECYEVRETRVWVPACWD